jgi:glycerol kinase
MSKYVLAIDQGTTSCRAILYDVNYKIAASKQLEIKQYYPNEGWVEHDPIEIWEKQFQVCQDVIQSSKILPNQIEGIGVTNQRETIVAWNRETGLPIYYAIVWQDRRTANACIEDEKQIGLENNRNKTGLNVDAYFSCSKIRWILENVEGARQLSQDGKICFGTMDTWIIYKLTNGAQFVTDYSNASRTNLFNIRSLQWDQELIDYYSIPIVSLADVKDSIGRIGVTAIELFGSEIPISAIAGDQQAALFGHHCLEPGMIKNTYGTGCFLLQNIGEQFQLSDHKLLTTIAWKYDNSCFYAIEGSIFNAGSALKWLKENLQLFSKYEDIDSICGRIKDTDGVVVVPAFTGLGAPYWDMYARGNISGLTRNSNRDHIIRATVESLAFQTRDIVETMQKDSMIPIPELRVDGGVSESRFLLQFLADILQIPVIKSESKECTALGVAMMAGIGVGLDTKQIQVRLNEDKFLPQISKEYSDSQYFNWKHALEKIRTQN